MPTKCLVSEDAQIGGHHREHVRVRNSVSLVNVCIRYDLSSPCMTHLLLLFTRTWTKQCLSHHQSCTVPIRTPQSETFVARPDQENKTTDVVVSVLSVLWAFLQINGRTDRGDSFLFYSQLHLYILFVNSYYTLSIIHIRHLQYTKYEYTALTNDIIDASIIIIA